MKLSPLDKLVSEYVRKRGIKRCGGCERCGAQKYDIQKDDGSIYPAWKQLQACHFHGRRKRSVRYDPDNLASCCAGCHMFLDSHPLEKCEFFQRLLGDEYEALNMRANITQKVDVELTTLYLNKLLKEIDDGQ